MNPRLLYYKPRAIWRLAQGRKIASLDLYSRFFDLYDAGSVLIDRTGTITTPVRTRSIFPMPAFRAMRKTYEDVCDERAKEIIERATEFDCDVYVMWSGGIDSTLALISLLKAAGREERKRLVVLLSEYSIAEYPQFYRDHIRGKLRAEARSSLDRILGDPHILVTGEHNDQLMGSDMAAALIASHGTSFIHAPYARDKILAHYESKLDDRAAAEHFLMLFERLVKKAPIPIQTNFDFLWWVNFSLKWQTVFMRMLTFTPRGRAERITREYVERYYMPFYCTDDLQLWSMNNLDKRIKGDWRSYKWVSKDIIYDFTKDKEYRDHKAKRGSLGPFMYAHETHEFLDEEFHLRSDLPWEDIFAPNNDFVQH